MPQWYEYVPAELKVCEYVWPFWKVEDWNEPSSAVMVCGAVSLFFQKTVSPAFTVIVAGLNAKFWMSTVTIFASVPSPLPPAAPFPPAFPVPVVAGEVQPLTRATTAMSTRGRKRFFMQTIGFSI
jgi:hypothetical protein